MINDKTATQLKVAKNKLKRNFLENRAKMYKNAKSVLQQSIIPGLQIYHDKFDLMSVVKIGQDSFQPFIDDDENGTLLFSQDRTSECVQITLPELISRYQIN